MSIDKKELKEYILKVGKESIEANKPRLKNLDEWTKRFEALRSTASLDDDVKKTPWRGASNVGIPLDATVVYTLHARLVKATWGVDPVMNIRPFDLPYAPAIQRYINWQMWEEMSMFMPLMLGYQGMLIDGDKIFKTCVDREEVFFDDDVVYFLNEEGEPYLSPDTGAPVEAENEDQPAIIDPVNFQMYKAKKYEDIKSRIVYYGPKTIPIPIKQFHVPQDADNIDPSKIDWCLHEFWRPFGWIYSKSQQNPELFDKDAVNALRKRKDDTREMPEDKKMQVLGIDLKTKTKRFKFWEWHGRYEDKKGKSHELIALMAPDEKEFFGYVDNRFYFRTGRRQFVHYTAYPQDGRFWGKGVCEWMRGIRSMMDALSNTGLDRTALYSNAPLLYNMKQSGFDPSEHKIGPGKTWGLNNIGPEMIRTLDLPQNDSMSLNREEMLFTIIQRLFGISDYSLGASGQRGVGGKGNASSKTASGIAQILQEGNIRFDVLIKQVQQEANPEHAKQIFKHFIMNRFSIMEESKELNKPKDIFDPIMQLSNDELNKNFEYVFSGSTSTVNPIIEQQQVSYLYETLGKGGNPFVSDDPDVMHELTEEMLNAYGSRIKIKSVDEFRKMSATEPNKAKKLKEDAMRQEMGLPGGGGQRESQLLEAGQ